MRRGALVWLVLLAAYATTLGIDAAPGERYSAPEAHRLAAAEGLAEGRGLDRRDDGQGVGLVALAAGAYALGGPTAVEIGCAALLALAFALAAAVARRLVPEPWATRSALVAGLSPPALAGATTIAPASAGAAVLTAAILLALRAREDPKLGTGARAAGLIALLPWLSVRLVAPGAVVAVALVRWLGRARRGVVRLLAVEVLLFSVVVLATVSERLFGGLVPSAAEPGVAARDGAGVFDRLLALLGTLVDRDAGLLRWAPWFVLAGVSVALLVRSRRDRVAQVLPERVGTEVAAILLLATVAAGLAAAALLGPGLHGPWLVPGDVLAVMPAAGALSAWGLRYAPRTGAALAALTLAGSLWLVLGARLGDGAGLAPPTGPLPWGGLELLLPSL